MAGSRYDRAMTMACWQRWMVAGLVAAVLSCLLLVWHGYWTLALPALALLLFIHATVLGLECLIGRRINREAAVPMPSLGQTMRAWLAECLLAPRVFIWRQPLRTHAVADHLRDGEGRRGVVFIHGLFCNRAFWNPWMKALRAQQRCFMAVNLEPPLTSIDGYVPTVEAAVRRVHAATGLPPVLVCHSMGGLAARAWLRTAGASERVHRIVTMGTPHRGAWLARLSRSVSARQMRIGAPWLSDLPGAEAARFTCWHSNCDNVVFPASNACLPGADNRAIDGLAHVEMAFDARVRTQTLALLERD